MIMASKGWESIVFSKYLFSSFSKLNNTSLSALSPKPSLHIFFLYIPPIYLLLESNGTERPGQRETVEEGGNWQWKRIEPLDLYQTWLLVFLTDFVTLGMWPSQFSSSDTGTLGATLYRVGVRVQ